MVKKLAFVPIEHWPVRDRSLWAEAKLPGRPFRKKGRAADFRPDTIRLTEHGYGTYLAWVLMRGALDPGAEPIDRISPAMIYAFAEDYGADHAPSGVALIVRGVAYLVRATHPPDGAPWLTRTAHEMANSASPVKNKTAQMASLAEILALGDKLMKNGTDELHRGYRSGAQTFRDGLMLTALATRPFRRRNLAALQIGRTFFFNGKEARVAFDPRETKTGSKIAFDYPDFLVPVFDLYLREARPILRSHSDGVDDGMLWVGRRGRPMDGEEITQRIGNVTKANLGRRIGPHLFRDCAATDIAIHDPIHVGITKSVLGHATLATSQKYYNQASAYRAALRQRSVIDALRHSKEQ